MNNYFNNQKGVAHILALILLLVGLGVGIYLVTQTQIFKPRASSFPIVIKSATGATLPQNASLGSYQTSSATVTIELNSPFGLSGVSSPNTGTVSYKFSETPDGLASASATPYTKAPTTFVYTFKNTALGNKYAWVEFLSKDGKTQRASATVEVTNPSGATSAGFGQAKRFTGTTTDPQYMFVANDSDLNPTNALTVEAWVKPTAQQNGLIVGKLKSGNSDYQYNMALNDNGTVTMCVRITDAIGSMCAAPKIYGSSAITPLANGWYHLAMTFDNNRTSNMFRAFVNGETVANTTNYQDKPNAKLDISNPGNLYIGGTDLAPFKGEIDEVRVSVFSQYNSNFGVPTAPFNASHGGILALFHLDGGGQDATRNVAGLKPVGTTSYTKSTVPYNPTASPATTPTPSIMPSPFASPSPSISPSPSLSPSPTPNPNVTVDVTSVNKTMIAGQTTKIFQLTIKKTANYGTSVNSVNPTNVTWGLGLNPNDGFIVSSKRVNTTNIGVIDLHDVSIAVNKTLNPGTYTGAFKLRDGNNIIIANIPITITIPEPTYKRMFITSTLYNGNLGGLAGADAKCQERADTVNMGGIWKAWLSDNKTTAAQRLVHSNIPYVNYHFRYSVHVTKIAQNWLDLTDGGDLFFNLGYDERSVSEEAYNKAANTAWPGAAVWTSTNTSGGKSTNLPQPYLAANRINSGDCSGWTSTSSYDLAGQGISGWKDRRWTNPELNLILSRNCNEQAHLYCFEQ